MATEIERKFIVVNDLWKESVTGSVHIRDGLVLSEDGKKVRVRITDHSATLALKGYHAGLVRSEFEYSIPLCDAEDIMRTLCDGRVLEKRRYFSLFDGVRWEIDLYEGLLEGVVLAEVEMSAVTQTVAIPSWAGREVTGDPEYQKGNMFKARTAALRAMKV
jgi:adenylate cyclase